MTRNYNPRKTQVTAPRSSHLSWWLVAVGVGLLVVAGLVWGWPRLPLSSGDGRLRVVAAENVWGSIAAQIGGDQVAVTSIVTDPSADPHLYESDARDAAALSSAALVVENGLGYDDFMDKLLAASPSQHRQVIVASQVVGMADNGANPHLWYNLDYAQQVAAAIAAVLAERDPAHRALYEQRLATFKASLQPIQAVISELKSNYAGAPVAYTERVPEYALRAAGLTIKTPVGFAAAIEDGNDPSPVDTQMMDALMTKHNLKALLYNAQATSSVTQHVRELADRSGVAVVAVTETMPAGAANYQAWQLQQDEALLRALEH
ncbi:MAG TPA: zinc ABC transporter substrate-binding protein [Candidatus Saccharimonadia bacterium]|nr:zinc ABC transporter substrate-binding protein [Candidatus Saccharimonadia bacterium]